MFGSRTTRLKLIAIFCCLATSVLACAECKKAQAEDIPHGANTTIQMAEKKLNYLRGTVLLPPANDEPAVDIVIEIYRRSGSQDFMEAMKQPRLAACVTGDDGEFSFDDIKPGRYFIVAGTLKPDGMNETYVPIILKKSWWRKRSGVKVTLYVGT